MSEQEYFLTPEEFAQKRGARPPRTHGKTARRRVGALPWLFLVFFAQEILLRVYIYEQPFHTEALLCIALFSLFYAVVVRFLACLLTAKANYLIAVCCLIVVMLLFGAQYIYYLFFGVPLAVYSIFNGSQVAEFTGLAVEMIVAHLPQLLSLFAPPLLLIIFGRRCFFRAKIGRSLITLLLAAAVYAATIFALDRSGHEPASPYELYFNENSPAQTQKTLGMMTGMRLDVQRTLFGFTPKDTPRAVVIPGEDETTETGGGTAEAVIYEPNVMDIAFASLIARETDSDLLAMDEYFAACQPTLKNAYTGMFAGKNLIFITAESFSHYLINKDLYPTIYRLATEGFQFTNMYTPIWGVSTSDGEYVAMSGLLPKSGIWSFSASADNDMPFALGCQFSALGYSPVIAYHNHSYTYYDRDRSHPNMGYDFRTIGHGLDVTEIWPESDLEMAENSVGDYLNDGDDSPFHIYYMTVSGHLEYNFGGNNMAARHEEEVADLPYSDEVRAYLACNMELEEMLAYLLRALEDAGELEDTVIVLSADHYPYGLSDASLNELAGHEVETNFERYRNGLIIWQADVEHQVIDEPVCSLDILPTVSNLFGLEYDSRLLMGRDIFAENGQPLVIFNNRSWITDLGSYNAQTGQVTGRVSDEYVQAVNELVNARFTYAAKILEKDYYRVALGQ